MGSKPSTRMAALAVILIVSHPVSTLSALKSFEMPVKGQPTEGDLPKQGFPSRLRLLFGPAASPKGSWVENKLGGDDSKNLQDFILPKFLPY